MIYIRVDIPLNTELSVGQLRKIVALPKCPHAYDDFTHLVKCVSSSKIYSAVWLDYTNESVLAIVRPHIGATLFDYSNDEIRLCVNNEKSMDLPDEVRFDFGANVEFRCSDEIKMLIRLSMS